eukprot:983013-Pyramimonas_sp.AAC.1
MFAAFVKIVAPVDACDIREDRRIRRVRGGGTEPSGSAPRRTDRWTAATTRQDEKASFLLLKKRELKRGRAPSGHPGSRST